MPEEAIEDDKKKAHRKRQAGKKFEKKKAKNQHVQELTPQQRNPKAFSFQSVVKTQRKFIRTQDHKIKKHHTPVVDRTPLDPPPVIVAVVGGPKVGKSTLLRCLIKNYTKQRLTDINGPVTIIAGKNKKVTFIEINNDINCMIDVAKVADIVLVMIDATFGIEMEVFEFLEICRTHGSPRIMGVLNHLDMLKDNKALKKKKKILKRRFQVELYPGAKLFYLAGLVRGEYLKAQVKNLSRYINLMKFRPLAWRTSHPYLLVDRYEDITNPESIRTNPKCDRDVVLYGYVRGVPLQNHQMVHIPGCGDFKLKDVSFLPDPCPFPEKFKKRSLNSKERLIYAPMSGVGGVVYDKDAVYIDLGSNRRHKKKKTGEEEDEEEEEEEAEAVLEPLLTLQKTTDEKQAESQIQVFSKSQFINNANDKNTRNKHVTFEDEEDEEDEQDEMDDEQETKDNEDENNDEDDDEEEEDDDEDEENDEMPKRSLPSFEVVEDGSGRVRRRAIFNDNLEENYSDESDADTDDDDDDDDIEENVTYKDEDEGESDEDDDESDDEEEEVSPPKKRQKSQLSGISKSERIDADSEDEYDVDNDLQQIVGNLHQEKVNGKCIKSSTTNNVENSEKRKKNPKAVKINKDMEVTSKIQSILEKIKNDQNPKPRTVGYDSGFDNDTEGDEEASSLSESEEDVPEEEMPNEEESRSEHEKELKEEEEDEDDDDDDDNKMDYRTEMFKEATRSFYQNQSTVSYLRKYIYGDVQKEDKQEEEDEGEDIGGLFRLASKSKKVNSKLSGETNMNEVDSSRYIPPVLRNWTSNELLDSIRDCFMTGEWEESKNAETLLKMDDEDRDLYGDFEDLETGQKFTAPTENEKEEKEEEEEEEKVEAEAPKEEEKSRKEKYLEKKKRLKELFDAEYDTKDDDYFESLKEEMNQQAQLNRSEFEGLEDEVRVQYEGFRPGMYVRLEFTRFPCEFITNFDSSYPVIVGGLLENESNMGFVRVRVKAHRWYPRILKNRDPLILSLGWRRFQTLMYYAKREDNFVMRSLKYARKYLHVEGMFWGPLTTVNTGFVALQNISDRVPEFRIAANGVVLEADQSCKIVKKLKLLGVPEKVVKKTAFVKNMFHTETEVAKFVGAKIQTQSGIRGIIKKSLGDQGLFRATFEDSIRRSDVVILKTWVPIDLTRFCSTLRTLLLTPQKKAEWQGMKTVSQIKREKGIKNEVNPDHLYTPITERREHIKRPLRIPRNLQKNLPYSLKPKIKPDVQKAQRVLVVKDPDEIKMDRFMGKLKMMMEEKMHKRKLEVQAQKEKYREQMSETIARREAREKRLKKAICRKISKKEGKQSKSFA